jgi:hypothetical protein
MHEHIEQLLPMYVVDAVDELDAHQIESHLKTCASCMRAIDDLEQVASCIGMSVVPIDPPQWIRSAVISDIRHDMPPTAPIESRDGKFRPRALTFPLLASLCVALIVGVGIETKRASDLQNDVSALKQSTAAVPSELAAALTAFRRSSVVTSGALEKSRAFVAYPATGDPTLIVLDMPNPPAGQIWQAWTFDSNGNPTAIGSVNTGGNVATIAIPVSEDDSAVTVAITPEAQPVPDAPTTAPIAIGEIEMQIT